MAVVLSTAVAIAALLVILIGPAGAQSSSRTVSEESKQPKSPGGGEASAAAAGLATQDLDTGGQTKDDLANALVGSGVSISNVTHTGANTAAGKFSGGTGILDSDIDEGIILSSGYVGNVVGPNVFDSITGFHGTPGDTDLDGLATYGTNDASVLEFDFVPNADKVFFSYVFSSDEYNEYVNSSFNDAFGFFVNGQNCAKTSGGDPVSINTINNGNPHGSGGPNSSLYINNDLSDGGGSVNTEMDGLTKALTCEAPVSKDQTNHIKLAIADASDHSFDSNVFLKAGSFSTTPPTNQPPTADAGGPYDVNEGSSVEVSAEKSSDPNNDPLSYAWDLDNDGAFDDAPTQKASFTPDDGPATKTVKVEVTDGKGGTATDEATVNVKNVAPTITSLTGATQALTGNSVSFTGSATDPSGADTSADFTWKWAIDGGSLSSGSNPFSTSFSSCGDHSVSATATDKDGGESAPANSSTVSVYDAKFLQPIDELPAVNTVQKGRVIPVKISVGCGSSPLTGLKPAIQLFKGNSSDSAGTLDPIETLSSSAADTTGYMRPVDGGYIYNLQVPSNATAGTFYTIRVSPLGDNTGASKDAVLKIRK